MVLKNREGVCDFFDRFSLAALAIRIWSRNTSDSIFFQLLNVQLTDAEDAPHCFETSVICLSSC